MLGLIRRGFNRPARHRIDLARQVVNVDLDLAEILCGQRQTHVPIHADDAAPPRWKRKGMKQTTWSHVFRLDALAHVAISPNLLGHVAESPQPVGQPPD